MGQVEIPPPASAVAVSHSITKSRIFSLSLARIVLVVMICGYLYSFSASFLIIFILYLATQSSPKRSVPRNSHLSSEVADLFARFADGYRPVEVARAEAHARAEELARAELLAEQEEQARLDAEMLREAESCRAAWQFLHYRNLLEERHEELTRIVAAEITHLDKMWRDQRDINLYSNAIAGRIIQSAREYKVSLKAEVADSDSVEADFINAMADDHVRTEAELNTARSLSKFHGLEKRKHGRLDRY